MPNSLFTNKTLLITGGTGSCGNAVLNRFLKTDIGEIRIFSRDEKKQDDMRHEFQAKMPEVADKIKFYIGDVRDLESCRGAMNGVDYIFHAAANLPMRGASSPPLATCSGVLLPLFHRAPGALDKACFILLGID